MNQTRSVIARLVPITLEVFTIPRRAEGQSFVEYALILALIAAVVIVAVTTLGGKLKTVFGSITNSL